MDTGRTWKKLALEFEKFGSFLNTASDLHGIRKNVVVSFMVDFFTVAYDGHFLDFSRLKAKLDFRFQHFRTEAIARANVLIKPPIGDGTQ